MWAILWKAAPTFGQAFLFPARYYVMRVRLVLLSLRHLLGRTDGCRHIVENADLYHDALRSGKPVVLLGWHQGPVELLHRIPHADPACTGRTKVLMTASAFAPALADFMHTGRAVDGKLVARPGDMTALRRWERDRGILAVMVDQAPGLPEAWIPVGQSGLQTPYPSRLLNWIEERQPERLFVTVHWESPNVIRFRYVPVTNASLKLAAFACMNLSESFGQERRQYNWSYPKIRPLPSDLLGIVREQETLIIDGVNVWDHAWLPGVDVFVNVPGERLVTGANFYSLKADNRTIEFIAGELSNGLWGFFAPTPPKA
jgi:hypothetical protein